MMITTLFLFECTAITICVINFFIGKEYFHPLVIAAILDIYRRLYHIEELSKLQFRILESMSGTISSITSALSKITLAKIEEMTEYARSYTNPKSSNNDCINNDVVDLHGKDQE